MAWDKLTPEALHEALQAAVTKGDPVPSIEACRRLRDLTPWPPSLFKRERMEPSKKAREHAVGLQESLDELRNFWSSAALATRHQYSGDADPVGTAINKNKFIFDDINDLDRALKAALRWTEPVIIGPREHWHQAAIALHSFFLAAIKTTGRPKAYGLSDNGPAVRFVNKGLTDLGWTPFTAAALLKCLKRKGEDRDNAM